MRTIFFAHVSLYIILSLLNLAILALTNEHSGSYLYIHSHSSHYSITDDSWPFILIVFSFVLAFIVTKIKKIIGKAKYVIIGFYSFIPLVVDLCFRRDRDIYVLYFGFLQSLQYVGYCYVMRLTNTLKSRLIYN